MSAIAIGTSDFVLYPGVTNSKSIILPSVRISVIVVKIMAARNPALTCFAKMGMNIKAAIVPTT